MKLFANKLFLVLLVLMINSTHAAVYKCIKDGKTNYSSVRCDDAAIVINNSTEENECAVIHVGLPSNKKRSGEAELHAIGIYEGPIHRGKDPSANKVYIKIYSSERPIVLALFNYEAVVWNITINKGAIVQEIIVNSSDGTQLSGINEKTVKVTRQNIGYTAYDKCTFYSAVASKIQEFSGLDVKSFQGAYRGIEFTVQTRN